MNSTTQTLIRCIDCKHWMGDREIDPETPLQPPREEWRRGRCVELKYELAIDLKTGWEGGVVDEIHTVATFGCAYGEPRP